MKIAMFTDIHWGARGNSIQHNADCAEYLNWFIKNLKKNKCDTIWFGGDWFENRNAINVGTLNSSFDALSILNDLNIPIYFCVGNHDLYHRESRKEISTHHFSQFKNLIIINDTLILEGKLAFFPYIFPHEYPTAAAAISKYKPKFVFGHFEFKNFIVTGSDRRMEHGLNHKMLEGPEYIFSGHFHKRQANDNVVYIGNTFPTNYGDAWDDARGMAVLDTKNGELDFIDWKDCPKYRKVKLSDVLNDPTLTFPEKCRVKCIIDTEIGYSDAQSLRDELTKALNLREFSLEENLLERNEAIASEDMKGDFDFSSLDEAVIQMLQTGVAGTTTINSDKLITLYQRLL